MKPATAMRLVSELTRLDADDFEDILTRARKARESQAPKRFGAELRCTRDHTQKCCPKCSTHVTPHQGCILR